MNHYIVTTNKPVGERQAVLNSVGTGDATRFIRNADNPDEFLVHRMATDHDKYMVVVAESWKGSDFLNR